MLLVQSYKVGRHIEKWCIIFKRPIKYLTFGKSEVTSRFIPICKTKRTLYEIDRILNGDFDLPTSTAYI